MSLPVHVLAADAQLRASASSLLADHGFAARSHASAASLFAVEPLEGCMLLDLGLPNGAAYEVQQAIARRGAAVAILVMGGDGDPSAAVRAMKLGAADFLHKPLQEDELIAAVERALAGLHAERGERRARAAAVAAVERLSRRERQTLEGLLAGLSNKAIARRLGISPRTIEMHRANMMAALDAATLPEALRVGIDAGVRPQAGEAAPAAPAPAIARLDPPPSDEPEAIRRLYEEKLRLALEASGDGAWDWDIARDRIELSPSLIERIGLAYGSTPDRLDRLQALMHPDDAGTFYARLDDHLEGRTAAFACEYRLRNGDGVWRWTEVRGRVVDRDTAGAPLRMVGTARDITDRKAEEAKASRDSALLGLARRGAGAATWDIDLDSGRTRLCARGRELSGLPADAGDEVAFDVWASRVHPDDAAAVRAAIDAAAATGEPASFAFRMRRSDGGWRPLLALGQVIGPTADAPRRLIGLTQDLSDAASRRRAFSLARRGVGPSE